MTTLGPELAASAIGAIRVVFMKLLRSRPQAASAHVLSSARSAWGGAPSTGRMRVDIVQRLSRLGAEGRFAPIGAPFRLSCSDVFSFFRIHSLS